MTFCEGLILNIIFLLFPFFFYLLFIAYNNNLNRKKCPAFLDIVNITSVYLIIVYSKYFTISTFLLLINIPLIISLYKKRKLASIFLALSIVVFYCTNYHLPLYLIIGEYTIYLVLFLFLIKKDKSYDYILNLFTFIKGIVLSVEIIYLIPNQTNFLTIILQLFIMLVVFYLITILVFKLITKGEGIVSFNNVLKELEKEKTLKNSLFKITHEIKNPIAVCKGYLSMMNYNDLEKVKKYNYIIKNEIERTLDIMDDFSDYTKININCDLMDFNLLIDDTLAAMELLFNEHLINIKTTLSSSELLIDGDYNRLKQVLVNILKNSVEAITQDGTIEISTKNKNKKEIQLIIKDNGCGMSEETLNKTGELFYTTKVKGTGLGVSLSKEIIKQHGGSIKYESKLEKGTKVTIILPKTHWFYLILQSVKPS